MEIINTDIEHVGLDDLRLHEANPRDGDVPAIEESIQENGFYGALIVQRSSGKVLVGNHRLQAARNLGMATVPVFYVDVSAERAMRILLADNRTNDLAGYNDDALADLLEHLATTDDELAGTGYDNSALDELLDDLGRTNGEHVEDPGAEVDRAEELKEKWSTAKGQLWTLGRHRLLCGDATDENDVGRLLDGAEPRLMVTDPPYGVSYDADWRSSLDSIDRATGRVENDDRVAWDQAWEFSPSAVAYCWHADRHASAVQVTLEKAGFEMRSQIVWVKPHFALSRGHYHWQHEPCWYAVREGENAGWVAGRDQSTVWEVDNGTFQGNREEEDASTGHGTQKPVECMERPIRNHEGDVYEPFCGSGTTIVAAERQGRTCYAMEISPAYTAVILERLSAMGLTPELVNT